MKEIDVVVIGAGQAGLSSAYHLRRIGYEPLVLDAEAGPGGAWRHRSPSLTMDRIHGIFDLPGVRRTPSRHDGERPAALVVPEYFGEYERESDLTILRPVKVTSVARGERLMEAGDGTSSGRLVETSGVGDGTAGERLVETSGVGGRTVGGRLVVASDAGEWAARAVVNATGTWSRPYWPYYPGSFGGAQLHYASYRGPDEFAGLRVVVVGGGASAAHVLAEVAGVAASTLWVTRRPPVWRADDFDEEARRQAVALVEQRVRDGLPPQSVVSVTGLGRTTIIQEALDKGAMRRQPMFSRLAPEGVVWDSGRFEPADVIVWATGFRSALDHLAPLHLREPGGGIKVDGTRVVKEPRLQLVGYGPSASTIGANRAGRTAAQSVRRLLTPTANVA